MKIIEQLVSHKRVLMTAMLLLLLIPTDTSFAGWGLWWSPDFGGASYAPDLYRSGSWRSGGYQDTWVIGSEMIWDSPDGVRDATCAWPFDAHDPFFTMDHTDKNDNLNAMSYGTNFSSPKVDTDNDQDLHGIVTFEEFEVTSLDRNFPNAGTSYHFYSVWANSAQGSGRIEQTPQMSRWGRGDNPELQTCRYGGYVEVWYQGRYRSSDKSNDDLQPSLGQPYSITVPIENTQYSMVLMYPEYGQAVEVTLSNPIFTRDDLVTYKEWNSTTVPELLSDNGVENALSIVTFKNPVTETNLNRLINDYDMTIVSAKSTYENVLGDDDIWTIGLLEYNQSQSRSQKSVSQILVDNLEETAQIIEESVRSSDSSRSKDNEVELQLSGFVSVITWIPTKHLESISNRENIYLVDATPSYLRLLASRSDQTLLDDTETIEPDGFPKSIYVDTGDMHVEMQQLSEVETPTSITVGNMEDASYHLAIRHLLMFMVCTLIVITVFVNPTRIKS